MIIMLNFPSPESDYGNFKYNYTNLNNEAKFFNLKALLPLVAITCLTNLPLWVLLLIKTIKDRHDAKKNPKTISEKVKYSEADIKANPGEIEKISINNKIITDNEKSKPSNLNDTTNKNELVNKSSSL